MAQKTLEAFVVISGRVDNTFGQIGTALINMGQTIDQISSKLINFGKESVEVYRDYQDSMLDAQVALSTTYGRGSQELASVMKTLDAQATEWAASTIFHTDDVANAIAQAAHANWDLEMILTGIPNAMRLAQAGSMDLSEAVDFIIKSVNGAGLGFNDLTDWIDEWTFAANSSAGDVQQFGEAMLKMGNTMKFAGSKEELLTMLAILHDNGQVGAAAGTLLRNTMLRLIAPTKKAKDAMADLKVTQDDINEAMSEVDGDTTAAVATLEKLGFSVYDDSGKLKDFITIFHDLGKATEGMSDEEKYAIWSAIFPTRTITGGMALIEELTDAYNGLYEALVGGDAKGYGEYAAETMMSGLTGSIETFNSKLERLKQITGEALEGDVTYWTDKLGQFVDKIATMDDANFTGLVGGLKVIAVAGPGLVAAGIGFRFLGFALGTTAGRIALGAIAIAALANAMNEFSEAKFEENFGNMTLDMEPIKAQLSEISAPFDEAKAKFDAYVQSMNTAVEAYTTKSSELSSGIISKMVTGTQLTDEEIGSFNKLGEDIGNALIDGIGYSYDAVSESFTLVSGGLDEAATDPLWISMIGLLEVGYGEAIAKARSLSQDLRTALTEGFADGHLTGEEAEKIQSILNEMNELLAIQTDAENYAESQRLMRKAQTLGLEGLGELTEEVNSTRDAEVEKLQYQRDQAHGLMAAYMNAHMGEYYGNDLITEEYRDQMLAGIDERYDTAISGRRDAYNDIIMRAFENAIHTSDLSEVDQLLTDIARSNITGVGAEEAKKAYSDYTRKNEFFTPFGEPGSTQAWRYYQKEVEALGGNDAVVGLLKYNLESGDLEQAQTYAELISKAGFLGTEKIRQMYADAGVELPGNNQAAAPQAEEAPEKAEESPYTISLTLDENNEVPVKQEPYHVPLENAPIIGTLLDNNGQPITQEPSTTLPSSDELAQMYGIPNAGATEASPYTIPLTIEGAEEAASTAHEEAQSALDSQGEVKLETEATPQEPSAALPSQDELAQMYGTPNAGVEASPYTIPLTIEGAGEAASEAHTEAQSALDAQGDLIMWVTTASEEPGVTLPSPDELAMDYGIQITGAGEEASSARGEIESVISPPVSTSVTFPGVVGAAASAYNAIKSQFRDIVQHVRIVTSGGSMPGMAEGGRATEPVVYGEDGPEWFIPERHDKNTANLIAMAAHASGFSLAELATMGGARMFADGGSIGSNALPTLGALAWPDMDYPDDDGSGGSGGNTYDVNYAPVIHADNAEGVEKVLSEDKKRLKRMLKELEEERELIGSVVSY